MLNGKPYILCADDLQLHQIAITEMLEGEFNLSCTNNGLDCIESIVQKIPDVLLLGDKMPLSSQHDTCKILRENAHYKHIPIISISDGEQSPQSHAADPLGCDLYLKQPVEKEVLIYSIKKLLR